MVKFRAYWRPQGAKIYSWADEWTLGTRTVQHPSVGRILFEASNPRCGENELPETVRRWRMSWVLQSVARVTIRSSAWSMIPASSKKNLINMIQHLRIVFTKTEKKLFLIMHFTLYLCFLTNQTKFLLRYILFYNAYKLL